MLHKDQFMDVLQASLGVLNEPPYGGLPWKAPIEELNEALGSFMTLLECFTKFHLGVLSWEASLVVLHHVLGTLSKLC